MQKKILLYVLSLPFVILNSQVWFQGEAGSGVSLNDTSYCNVDFYNIFSNSTSVGSGVNSSIANLCASDGEGIAYQSTDSVSGYSFSDVYFCDIDEQLSIFTSSVDNSGFDFSSINLCNTIINRIPYRSFDGSGFKSVYEACIIPMLPLPIELLDFRAISDGNNVILFWSTASEINNDYFIIERSKNGIYWEGILEVEGAGDSYSITSYEDIDYDPLLGVSYYRLKQVDFDGTFSYSKIEIVNFETKAENDIKDQKDIIAYPNPAKGIITFVGKINDFTVFNMVGQNVQLKITLLSKDNDLLKLDIQDLSSGIYVLRTSNNRTCRFNVK